MTSAESALPPPRASRALVLAVLLLVRVAAAAETIMLKWILDRNARGGAGASLVFGLYRNAGALPLMFALGGAVDGPRAPRLRDTPHIAALSATAVLLSQSCYLIGLRLCNRRALTWRQLRACVHACMRASMRALCVCHCASHTKDLTICTRRGVYSTPRAAAWSSPRRWAI
jgi:hypothetical protein